MKKMNNLKSIQFWMKKNKIDIFLVNRTDEFFNEYIASYAQRLKWISNFSGSAAKAIILQSKSFIFVDGRYTLQANQELNKKLFKVKHINEYWNWLDKNTFPKINLGVDPSLHSINEITKLEKITNNNKSSLLFLKKNPIDLFWTNKPGYPKTKVFIHPIKYSGMSINKKIKILQSILKKEKIDYYLITSLDSLAWLLNLRGRDISYNPLTISYLIIPLKGKVELFIENYKIKHIKKILSPKINFNSFSLIKNYISGIKGKKILGFDSTKTNYNFKIICVNNKIAFKHFPDPCFSLKAQKNKIEIAGAKKANIRDGLSVTKYLFFLKNLKNLDKLNEISAAKRLYNFRKNNKLFFSLSFETISAINANAALPHYRQTKDSNLKFKKNSIYLVDSGAQYFDGTTDITRTIIIGKPTRDQREKFTRVLKGHISLAKALFKKGTKGSSLDFLARKSLKEIGCDYDHGTGHGVGSFLSVHEGPQRISKPGTYNDTSLKEGMLLSNEPGYYKEGNFGIRIENLILVNKKSKNNLGFDTISFAPIDRDLILKNIMSLEEVEWINNYHKNVYKKLSAKLNIKERIWLQKVTSPL